jgi:glutaredoxin
MTEPKNELLVTDGCPHCAEAKELFQQPIARGDIELVDALGDRGSQLADEHGINGVPELVHTDADGTATTCKLTHAGTAVCADGRTLTFDLTFDLGGGDE